MAQSIVEYPFIESDQIEMLAERTLVDFFGWLKKDLKMPVPTEVLAEQYFGYQIEITDQGLFSDPDYLGGIVFEDNVIKINAVTEFHEGRYNFTLAHEIGHHVLHKQVFMQQQRIENEKIVCRETGDKLLVEQQADRFAAALLMPKDFVRAAFARADRGSLPLFAPNTRALRSLANSVLVIGKFTNVSNTAMVNRLIDLRLVSGAQYQTGTPQDFFRQSVNASWLIKNPFSRFAYKAMQRMRSSLNFRRSK